MAEAKKSADSTKQKALDVAIGQIEKSFGKGSIQRMGEIRDQLDVSVIPTNCISLDLALGVGGIPRGRVIEMYGPEASGKSTLALHIIAQAQKLGGIATYIDAEHALDPDYSSKLGVNVDDLLLSQPDNAEQALEIAEMLIRSNAVDVIVVDSVAALVPRAEIEGEMGEMQVGLQARIMSQALRKLTAAISKSKTSMIFINQLREKVGVFFGNPETTPGGRALKFYSSIRLDIRRIDNIKDGTDVIGSRMRVKVVKNKVAPPFRQAELDLIYAEGISAEGDLIDTGAFYHVLQRSGTWFSFENQQLGQGRENVRRFLKEHPEVALKIREGILAKAKPTTVTEEATADTDAAE